MSVKVVAITIASVLAFVGLFILLEIDEANYERQVDVYCSPGWNSACIKVPEGTIKHTPDGCIEGEGSKICGTYNKIR